MKDFLSRKQKYFDRLYENPEIVEGIINDERNKGKPIINIIFNPNTENELAYANSVMTLFIDINDMNRNDLYVTDKPDYDNNSFIKYMNELMMALKERNPSKLVEIQKELKKYSNPKECASLAYDMMRAFLCNVEETLYVMSEKSGFDWYDNSQQNQFTIYFQQANAIINSSIHSPLDTQEIDFDNNQTIEFIQEFTKAFHETCKSQCNKANKNNRFIKKN